MIDMLKNIVFGEKTYLKDLPQDIFQISTFSL